MYRFVIFKMISKVEMIRTEVIHSIEKSVFLIIEGRKTESCYIPDLGSQIGIS